MLRFEKLLNSVYVLKVPNGGEWTGVYLLTGEENLFIDCGPSAAAVENYIVPALNELGLRPSDISWVTNTHAHGDHSGGDYHFLKLSGAKLVNSREIAAKLANPLPHSVKTRAKWPEHSPAAPSFIQENRTDVVIEEGDTIAKRLKLILTPGHDTESVSFYDLKTNSLFTGDSLQEHGTVGERDAAGIAFYKDLPAYLETLRKLSRYNAENLFAAHDFKPYGFAATGRTAVKSFIDISREAVALYDREIQAMLAAGQCDLVQMTRALLKKVEAVDPEYLFMAMYTVNAHLEELAAK